jgi:hypothetical protein
MWTTNESEAAIKAQRWALWSWEFTALKHQARQARKHASAPVSSARRRNALAQFAREDATSPTEFGGSELAEDLLVGAVAIAQEMNWRDGRGQWNVRRVYNIYSKGTLPIHYVPGLGVCARRSSLRKFFSALDERLKVQPDTVTR